MLKTALILTIIALIIRSLFHYSIRKLQEKVKKTIHNPPRKKFDDVIDMEEDETGAYKSK